MAESKQCVKCGAEIPRETPWFGVRKYCTRCTVQKLRAQARSKMACGIDGCDAKGSRCSKRIVPNGYICKKHWAQFKPATNSTGSKSHVWFHVRQWLVRRCIVCSEPFLIQAYENCTLDSRHCSQRCASKTKAQTFNPMDVPEIRARHGQRIAEGMAKMPRDWGAWWEKQRIKEDKDDLRAFVETRGLPRGSRTVDKWWIQRQRQVKHARRSLPEPRRWIAGTCSECGASVVIARSRWRGYIYCDAHATPRGGTSRIAERGFVYVLRRAELVKIGRTVDPKQRFAALRAQSSRDFDVVRVIPTFDAAGLERALHRRYQGERVHREWFMAVPVLAELTNLADEDLDALIRTQLYNSAVVGEGA